MKKLLGLTIIIIAFTLVWIGRDSAHKDNELSYDDAMSSSKMKAESEPSKTTNAQVNSARIVEEKSQVLSPSHSRHIVASKVSRSLEAKSRGPSSIESYFQDDKVSVAKKEFLISQTLRTLPVESYQESDGTLLAKMSGYVFFESTNTSIGQPALYDLKARHPVVLTGRVVLNNLSSNQAQSIADQMQVDLDTSMAHLGVYAFVAPEDVFQVVNEIGESISAAEIIEGRVHEK